jgi:hypothetical protein
MPRPTKRQKDAAFNQQQTTSAAAIGASTAAVGLALIPVAGIFVAAGVAIVGATLPLRALHLGRLAHDPPRDDYRLPTTVASGALDTAGLGESDGFRESSTSSLSRQRRLSISRPLLSVRSRTRLSHKSNTVIEVVPERPVAELIRELETLAEADLDYAEFLSASLSEEAFLEAGVS